MRNIFREHYRKRDGAIFKDLAGLSHDERIKTLKEYIDFACEPLKHDAYKHAYQLRAIRFYQRLIKFCNKNKNIPAEK